ncbi:hypothetical protein HZH66_014642 [Vespula vulgaris]|uniref:PiggyBac transposable element-derived protein domain-containing protein n=1 Tax=Vespula vulgaris TaxID=7454 RepID=A0A834J254_VESVU|nr:hypothetical protein HZH66_014642 [Vespula vulgaris]
MLEWFLKLNEIEPFLKRFITDGEKWIIHTDILSLTGNVIKCFLLRLVSFTLPNVTLEIGGDLLLSASSLALISTRAPLMVMKYAMVRCHYHVILDFNEIGFQLMSRKYSAKSKSYRWPVQVSFNILDWAGINVWILYKETSGQNISRQQFLLQIAEELAKEYHEFLQEEKENLQGMSSGQGNISYLRKTCQIRLRKKKITKLCIICKKYVWIKCSKENPIIYKKCH